MKAVGAMPPKASRAILRFCFDIRHIGVPPGFATHIAVRTAVTVTAINRLLTKQEVLRPFAGSLIEKSHGLSRTTDSSHLCQTQANAGTQGKQPKVYSNRSSTERA